MSRLSEGLQGSGVANVAAATYAAPAVTIETLTESSTQSTPDTTIGACGAALAVIDVTATGNCPSEAAMNAFAVIVDDNFANLADQQSKTRVDNANTLVELDDLADDVALLRTAVHALLASLETAGILPVA